jgi:ABC-2 type transport system permease protein
MTAPVSPVQASLISPPVPRRVRAAFAAEWIKLRSLRSMLVVPLLAAVFCLGLSALVCSRFVATWAHRAAADRAGFVPFDVNFGFLQLGVLFFGVFGALVMTNEYRSGLIRTTLAAAPQRLLLLAAKTVLAGLAALAVAAAICFAAFFIGQQILAGAGLPHVTPGSPGVLGHLLGAVGYLTAAALLGLCLGAVLHNAAGAITGVFALLLVVPVIVQGIPHDAIWRHTVPYLPSNLGNAVWFANSGGLVSPRTGALGLVVYVVVLLAAAALTLRSRDA